MISVVSLHLLPGGTHHQRAESRTQSLEFKYVVPGPLFLTCGSPHR
jgi:hypothetical protein